MNLWLQLGTITNTTKYYLEGLLSAQRRLSIQASLLALNNVLAHTPLPLPGRCELSAISASCRSSFVDECACMHCELGERVSVLTSQDQGVAIKASPVAFERAHLHARVKS